MQNYQYLIPTLTLPDVNDRHVLAAAIHSNSSVIVTYNLKDFPKDSISRYGIEAQHPDDQIPAPTLHFKEGDHVTINIYNHLDKEVAIHF